MKIHDINLHGYQDIFNQVITGNSVIQVVFSIGNYHKDIEILIDASNYSNKGVFVTYPKKQEGNLSFFEETIRVDFLGSTWLCCWKNKKESRVKILLGKEVYFSNPIWDYEYTEDCIAPRSNFYEKWDHHLWVYNQFEEDFKEETYKISELWLYPNDIIFIDRNKRNTWRFINLELEINQILERYIWNLRIWKKSILYIEIFSHEDDFFVDKINKIFGLFKEGTFFFYNTPFCLFKDLSEDFIKTHVLYNHHFRPILGKGWRTHTWCNWCMRNSLCNGVEQSSSFHVNPF